MPDPDPELPVREALLDPEPEAEPEPDLVLLPEAEALPDWLSFVVCDESELEFVAEAD